MTREEAKREIDFLDYYLQNHTDDYGEESHTAMMMAIQALEQEPSEDAISREAVLDTISELNAISFYEAQEDSKECYYEIRQAIKDLSPVKQEPKTGHWITLKDEYGDVHEAVCSNCDSNGNHKWKYCPKCGAKMEVEQNG